MIVVGIGERGYFLEKGLALLAAIVTPAYAIISQYSKKDHFLVSGSVIVNSMFVMLNVIAECAIGIFLIVGLLANTNFMLGTEEFSGIKLALIVPILLIIYYFAPKSKEKLLDILDQKISVMWILIVAALLGIFGVVLARSGNFTLPVPGFEKYARQDPWKRSSASARGPKSSCSAIPSWSWPGSCS